MLRDITLTRISVKLILVKVMQDLLGTYAGIVELNSDPEKRGRIKVRVPHVYGTVETSFGFIGTDNIPWALPAGLPAGGSPASGGIDWIPEIGDQVFVRFLDGEPEKPVWEWGVQTRSQQANYLFHHYDSNRKPIRAGLTRYGHTFELNDSSLIATTSKGYRLVFTDASSLEFDGILELATPKGNFLNIDDLTDTLSINVNLDLTINAGEDFSVISNSASFATVASDFNVVSGAEFRVVAKSAISLETSASMSMTALNDISLECFNLLLGLDPTEPFVLGNQLAILLTEILIHCQTHVHNLGASVTGSAIPVPVFTVTPPQVLSKTIFGQ